MSLSRRKLLFAASAAALGGVGCAAEPSGNPPSTNQPSGLAGRSLQELRDLYHADLFDDFLPFMDRHVVDHELGGFLCNTDRSGRNLSQTKTTWYEGRGIWVYSFLYNRLAPEERYLETARKSAELILPHRPEPRSLWPASLTREGQPLNDRPPDIYGGLFVANGLSELSEAAGDPSLWDAAKSILDDHLAIYDDPGYVYDVAYGPDIATPKGPRVLGHWMVLLRLATQMLEKRPDDFVEGVADRCLEAILDGHYNPSIGLLNEVVLHDLSRPKNGLEQFSYTGHAVETLWMVLFEARRRGDAQLHKRAAEMFRRHVEVSWDDLYGGFFRSLDHADRNEWKLDKVLWLQEEVLIGTLFMIEHADDPWARRWFDKTYRYVREKFPLAQYGYPLWILGADRKVTFEEEATRVGNFHHPRHLMLNLLALDRLIARAQEPPSTPNA